MATAVEGMAEALAKAQAEASQDKETPKTPKANCEDEAPDDEAVKRTAFIRGALNAAIIGINTATALKIAKMNYDLAKDYAKLAEDYRNYYNDNYKPIEKELIKEAMDEKEYVRDKDDLYKGQMLISAKLPFVGKAEKLASCTGRYCTGQRQAIINDIMLEQAMVESMVCGMAHRYADDEALTRDTYRWERRNQVLKLGRDIPVEAISYASLATGIFGSIGQQASAAVQGASWYLGFGGDRVETKYPPRRGELSILRFKPNVPHVQEVEPYKSDYKPVAVPSATTATTESTQVPIVNTQKVEVKIAG